MASNSDALHATSPADPSSTSEQYRSILNSLLAYPPLLSSLPTSPHPVYSTTLQHSISDLQIHPTLEAALHLLNLDLPAAHFLLRHMQNKPAFEAMFLHGILHRIEGDYNNTRAWYKDVKDSEVFNEVWAAGLHDAEEFVNVVERFRKEKKGDKESLRKRSRDEILRVIRFCETKFGTERVEDARTVWVGMSEKEKAKAGEMIVGGEGWREF